MKLERKQKKKKRQTKLGTPGLKETLFFEQKKVNHQTKERMRIMAVLKSWSRSTSLLQTALCPVRDGAASRSRIRTRHVHSLRGAGVELRKVSLEGLVLGSSSSSLPGYNE